MRAQPADAQGYEYLEHRPGSFYRELFVRGVNLRASRLVGWMESEGMTAEQAAADRRLPLAAVLEAVRYVRQNRDFLMAELKREQRAATQRTPRRSRRA